MAPNPVTALVAFSTSAREVFEDFLKTSTSRYRIFREKRDNILSWVKDDSRVPKTQQDYSQHNHALQSFRYDIERDMLLSLPSEGCSKEQQVVVEGDIFRIIE